MQAIKLGELLQKQKEIAFSARKIHVKLSIHILL